MDRRFDLWPLRGEFYGDIAAGTSTRISGPTAPMTVVGMIVIAEIAYLHRMKP